MSVTLLDIWRAARARSVPFSGESAGYVTLALCEEMRGLPRAPELADVELASDGSVRLMSAAKAGTEQCEKQLRALLARLLEVASSPGPALWRAAGRNGAGSAGGLASELQKALIPCNRAAARRGLLRLYRETERAIAEGRLGAGPDSDEGLLRLSPPPAKVAEAPPAKVVDALLSATAPLPPVRTPPVVSAPPVVAAPRVAEIEAPFPAEAAEELRADGEHMTRPETVVARRRAHLRSWPPPLPVIEHGASPATPRMGSMDVAVVALPSRARTPSPPPLPVVSDDLTERVPEVAEFLANDQEPPPLSVEAARVEAVPHEIPEVLEFVASGVDESPALVVGVDVADSEEAAQVVDDEEIETRPLPVLAPPMPYAGVTTEPTDVSQLLRGFQVAEGLSESELRRELKALAGVDLTPASALGVIPR